MINVKELKALTKNLTLMYVEDEDELRESVETYLRKLFSDTVVCKNGQEGIDTYKKQKFDIVISDIQMPLKDGLEMSKEIKEIDIDQEIIITSAYSDVSYFLNSIAVGINGYIIKPIDYAQMNQEIYKSSTKVVHAKENKNYKLNLEVMVNERTEKILSMEEDKIENFENTILSFVEMIENRDTYTGGHSQRVATYSKLIAKEMGLSKEESELLYKAGIIHDIGKVATPDTILLKPGKLNDLEYKLIQEHVDVGYKLLSKIPMYKEHAEVIIGHHERYDGKGYPRGLKGDELPILSYILAAADSFDAMTTNRIYKGRKNVTSALKELKDLSGKQFHPEVVKSALIALNNIEISKEITQLPETEVERERFSYFFRDQVTGAYNYDYLNFILEQDIFNSEFTHICKLSLDGFGSYNTRYGWTKGDIILNSFSSYLQTLCETASIFRVHGNDFIVMSKKSLGIDVDELKEFDFFKDTSITVTKKTLKLEDVDITNMEELEKLI